MPVRSDPQAGTQKWVANLSNATTRMQAGAMRVSVAPGQLAAQAADKWLQRVTASKDKYKANSAAVSLQAWQNAYTNIGIPRVSQGAQAKQQKVTDFLSAFLPHLQRGLDTIDKMPSTTLEDGIARATAMIRWNAKFKKGVSNG